MGYISYLTDIKLMTKHSPYDSYDDQRVGTSANISGLHDYYYHSHQLAN